MADIGSLLGSAGIGGAIGKAIVSLELDTKKYQAELKGAQAQTVASTNAMQGGLSKFGGLASAAFKVAGIGAVAFAAYSVKAAIDANDAQLKLQNTFANNPKLADSSAAAFTRQADALRELTGVDDEAIISGQALLGQFDLTGKQVQQLTPAVVDLSAKMGIDLEAAFKAVGKATTGSAGVLSRYGIVLDAADLEADAFGTTLEGLGVAAGFAADRAENEPWRVLASDFEEIAEQVGQVLLPVLQDLVGVIEGLLPILKFAADNLDLVLSVLVGFAAIKYLPILINAMAAAFVRLQVAMGASLAAQGAASAGFAAIATGVPYVTAAVLLLANAWKVMSEEEQRANEALTGGINRALEEFAQGSSDANANLIEFGANFAFVTGNINSANGTLDATQLAIAGLRQEFVQGNITQGEFAQALSVLGLSAQDVNRILRETTNGADEFTHHIDKAGKTVQNFANLTNKELKEFKSGVIESLQVTAGQFETLNDAFDTTPRELAKQMRLAVQIARTAQRDLREIAEDKSISDGVKKALAELPANQRHAWAEGGKAVKRQIEQDAVDLQRLNAKSAREAANAFGQEAKTKGKGAGHDLAAGVALGIESGGGLVTAAARKLIQDAEDAMRDEAKAESPSKVMKELGLDLMEGLYQGITTGAQKVIDAERKSIEKLIEGFQKGLDKVKGLASEFAGTISGAIGGFGDIGGAFGSAEEGTSLSAVIATQLGGAQALADVLEALKRQGASRATLGQVAETGTAFGQAILQGGPEQIREMNQALADIAALAKETGKGLSEKFFGQEIARLEKRLEKQNDQLHELVELERLGHSHAIILNGQKVSEAVRDELVKTGKRNPGAGIP